MSKRSVNLNKYFDSKDYNYWLFILVLLLVGLSTSQFGNNVSVLNYVSFAGTITSILLAVVAIIYSFFQNFSNINLNQKLIESADKIEKSIANIDSASKDISSTSSSIDNATNKMDSSSEKIESLIDTVNNSLEVFNKVSEELTDRFESFSNDLQYTVNTRMEIAQSKISEVFDLVNSQTGSLNNPGKFDLSNSKELTPDMVKTFVDNASITGVMALYCNFLMYKKNKTLDLNSTLSEKLPYHGGYMFGYMVASANIGIIGMIRNKEDKTFSVTYYNETLQSIIEDRVKSIVDDKADSLNKSNIELKEKIENLFSDF